MATYKCGNCGRKGHNARTCSRKKKKTPKRKTTARTATKKKATKKKATKKKATKKKTFGSYRVGGRWDIEPTQRQLDYIASLELRLSDSTLNEIAKQQHGVKWGKLNVTQITRGQAADLISAMKWASKQARAAQQQEVAQTRTERQQSRLAARGVPVYDEFQGMHVGQQFRFRGTIYTITSFNPRRWKFPVSAMGPRGGRWKFRVDQVKGSNQFRRRNPDLLFADTADEALLPRQELLARQRARGLQRKRSRLKAARRPAVAAAPAPRCLSVPTESVIKGLQPYNSEHRIRESIAQAGQLCPENISQGDFHRLMDALESLAQRPRRRRSRLRSNPQESVAMLARRTMTQLRRARARMGMDVF